MNAYAAVNDAAYFEQGLVESLRELADGTMSTRALESWREAVHSAADPHADLSVALAMFDVGVEYIILRDAKNLLDLPIEQRSVACSPFSDPRGMRVSEARLGKERLDDDEATKAA